MLIRITAGHCDALSPRTQNRYGRESEYAVWLLLNLYSVRVLVFALEEHDAVVGCRTM